MSTTQWDTKQMREEHCQMLRRICKLEPCSDLPPSIVDMYWRFKAASERINAFVGDRDLVVIAALAMLDTLPGKDPMTLLDRARNGEFEFDAPMKVRWRGGHLVDARYRGVNGRRDKIVVVLDDETGIEREIDHKRITLPESRDNK